MTDKLRQIIKNLDFIRGVTGLSVEKFFSADKNNSESIVHIAANTYYNYKAGKYSPNEKDITAMVDDINKAIKKNAALSLRFPKGIFPDEFENQDLEELSKLVAEGNLKLLSDKFIGNYLCYYMSTKVEGKNKTQYGVLQISKGDEDNVFVTNGVFSLKSIDEAQRIYSELQAGKSFATTELNIQQDSIFSGSSYLSLTVLWINLSNRTKSEHVSLSFDFPDKVHFKNTDLDFSGARGLALSQTSGYTNQTTTFPIVIAKLPVLVSPNELSNHLHFNYSKISESELDQLSTKVVNLSDSLLASSEIDKDLRIKLISQIVEHEVKDLLNKHIFNAHYYEPQETDDFYKKIIRPLRRGEKE